MHENSLRQNYNIYFPYLVKYSSFLFITIMDTDLEPGVASSDDENQRSIILLKKYLTDCNIKSHAHSLASNQNRIIAKRANWLSGIFPAFAGVLSVGTFSDLDSCGNMTNEMLVGFTVGLSFLSTICTLTKSVFRFSEKEIEHHNSSSHYGDISSDIELYLAKRVHHNGSLKSFLNLTHELLLVRESSAPPIPAECLAKAREVYSQNPSGRSPVLHKIEIASFS